MIKWRAVLARTACAQTLGAVQSILGFDSAGIGANTQLLWGAHGPTGPMTAPALGVLITDQVPGVQMMNTIAKPACDGNACSVIAFGRLAHFFVPKAARKFQRILELAEQGVIGPNRYLRHRLQYRNVEMGLDARSYHKIQLHESSLCDHGQVCDFRPDYKFG